MTCLVLKEGSYGYIIWCIIQEVCVEGRILSESIIGLFTQDNLVCCLKLSLINIG